MAGISIFFALLRLASIMGVAALFIPKALALGGGEEVASEASQWSLAPDLMSTNRWNSPVDRELPAEEHSRWSVQLGSSEYLSRETQFFSADRVSGHASSLTLQAYYHWRGILDGALDVKDRVAFDEKTNYLMPREVYGGWQFNSHKLWIGRKHYVWSEADEQFHRGLFEGRFMNDKLQEESYGLTGLFLSFHWGGGKAVAFASPLYIPELGPDYELKEGKFSSASPFFRPPSRIINFLGVDTPLSYHLVKPPESEIIFNPSYAAMIEQTWGPLFWRSSYAYKPMNQLLMGAQFYFQHSALGNHDIRVNVHPRWVYHHLGAVEGGYARTGGWKAWLSLMHERPEKDHLPDDWTYQDVDSSSIVTSYLGYDVSSSPLGETQLYISYSQVFGGDRPDQGEFTAQQSFFERRYQFYKIMEVGMKGARSYLFGRRLIWNTRLAFDQAQQGGLWLSDFAYSLTPQLKLIGSLDLLGLVNSVPAEISDGFLSEYRANDRAQLGVEYVF